MRKRNGNGIRITDNGCTKAIHTQDTTNTSELTMNTDIVGAWVGVVEKCGARTAATRVSVSGNLGDLFDIVSESLSIKHGSWFHQSHPTGSTDIQVVCTIQK